MWQYEQLKTRIKKATVNIRYREVTGTVRYSRKPPQGRQTKLLAWFCGTHGIKHYRKVLFPPRSLTFWFGLLRPLVLHKARQSSRQPPAQNSLFSVTSSRMQGWCPTLLKSQLVFVMLTLFRWLLNDMPSFHLPWPEEALHLETLKTKLRTNLRCLGRWGICLTGTCARSTQTAVLVVTRWTFHCQGWTYALLQLA